MSLCFIEPQDAVRAVAGSVGTDSRHQLLIEVIRAWVDSVPDDELEQHYARVITDLDEEDLTMLAAWHASLSVGAPIASRDFLVGAFHSLGEHRREALRIAAAFCGSSGVSPGLGPEDAMESVLPWLSQESQRELAAVALEIYVWDRLGTEN